MVERSIPLLQRESGPTAEEMHAEHERTDRDCLLEPIVRRSAPENDRQPARQQPARSIESAA